MPEHYETPFPLLEQNERQNSQDPISRLQVPLAISAASILGLGLSSFVLNRELPRPKLVDDPMCGITTGGKVINLY